MKLVFNISIILMTLNCFSQKHIDKQYLINGTDSCKIKYADNFINIDYNKYFVLIDNNGTIEKKITIIEKLSKDTLFTSVKPSDYFKGIIENYLIIDNGTGNIRNLMIYDFNKKEFIQSTKYKGDLVLEKRKIIYYYPFINEEPPTKPDCPESKKWESSGGTTGYLEKRIYDFDKREIIKTGQIKCDYFE